MTHHLPDFYPEKKKSVYVFIYTIVGPLQEMTENTYSQDHISQSCISYTSWNQNAQESWYAEQTF